MVIARSKIKAKNKMVEEIILNGELCAVLIKKEVKFVETKFFTDEKEPLQIGVFVYNEPHEIQLHKHNRVPREVEHTQEVILCREGDLICTIYDERKQASRVLHLYEGDIIYFVGGWHKFAITDKSKFIEIKNGPYIGDKDKTRSEE